MIYTRGYFKDVVLVLRNKEQLEKVLKDLNCDLTDELMQKEFPVIVYMGLHESIDISEITEENLNKLKRDKDFSRRVFELIK